METAAMIPSVLPRGSFFSMLRDVWRIPDINRDRYFLTDEERDEFKRLYPRAKLVMIAACVDTERGPSFVRGRAPRIGDVVYDTEEELLLIIELTEYNGE